MNGGSKIKKESTVKPKSIIDVHYIRAYANK